MFRKKDPKKEKEGKESKKDKKGSKRSKESRKSSKTESSPLAANEEKATTEGPPSRPPPNISEVLKVSNSSGDFSNAAVEPEPTLDEPGLVFTGEIDNGMPVVKGGNIQKLVDRLTHAKYHDPKFVKAFLLTFRSFTTPTELFQLLMDRFNFAADDEGKVVRLRVFNVLKQWLNTGYYDFRQDQELKSSLQNFVESNPSPPATSLQKIIDKHDSETEKEYEHIFSGNQKPPEPHPVPIASLKDNFLSYHPEELARQLTLIEYRLFAAIKPSECVSQHWMSKKKEELAPNILKMISHFNDVSNWVQSEIVKCTDLPTRIQTLKHVVEIAEYCKGLNNFNAVMEIISGLHSSSIFRLKQTWAGLKKGAFASYEEMHALTSRDFSYKAFRTALRQVNPPCIPYLGMYLTDLTFIEEGNQDLLPDGLINFTKRQRLSEVIEEIQTYQNTPYCLKDVPAIQKYLKTVEILPEGQIYDRSLRREGRRGTAAVETPDSPYGDLESKPGYLFDKPDSDDTITFEKKDTSDGTVNINILSGTLIKLVERLTHNDPHGEHSSHGFLVAFLMTLETFTTPLELLNLLDNRFDMPKPKDPSKQQLEKFYQVIMVPTHVRIFNLLKSWINSYPEDFVDTEVQNRVNELLAKWFEASTTLKSIVDAITKLFEKKISEPLPTPECRFIGFLSEEGSAKEFEGKTVLNYDEESLAQQITLIEQNFFASIRGRECLAQSWDPQVMEEYSPNILALKQNFEILRRFVSTQVLIQTSLENKYRAVTSLVFVAEKLLGFKNFMSSMAITSGLQYIQDEYPALWAWVPLEVIRKYKELELLLKVPKRIKVLEKTEEKLPTIPFIDLYMTQLNGISNLMPDMAGNGTLINFERRRKQWEIFRVLETYQSMPYPFEYSGTCGSFLYHASVWDDNKIAKELAAAEKPAPPEIRPELRDFRSENNAASADFEDFSIDESLSPTDDVEGQVNSLVKEYLLSVLQDSPEDFKQVLKNSSNALAEQLMSELRQFKQSSQDELAVMQGQLGISVNPASFSRIVSTVFPGSSSSQWTETDAKGAVYGWKEQVFVQKVNQSNQLWLIHITGYLDQAEASTTLRLFQFFSSLGSATNAKQAVIVSSANDDALGVLSGKGISVFSFSGDQL